MPKQPPADAPPPPDERELLRRCGKRDQEAFGELYERHADGVLRYLRNRLGDAGAAEEIAQETFFLLWDKARKIQTVNGSVFPWLYTTAKYLAANYLRRKGNQPMLDIDDLDVGRALADVSAESLVVTDDTIRRVRDAVAGMGEADRQIFLIHFVGGGSHKDIADQLGLTRAAVKNRVLRLRARLKTQFAETLHSGGGD